jgi:hypothetical protein
MSPQTATIETASSSDVAAAAVFTSADIAAGRSRANYVFRNFGTGLWYFLAYPGQETAADQMVPMKDLMRLDPSLGKLRAMPPGCGAKRAGMSGDWQPVALAAPAVVEEDPADSEADRIEALRLRRHSLANQASTACVCLGLLTGMLGGMIILTATHAEVLGHPSHLVLGIPFIAAGLWTMICGFVAGANRRPLSIVLAALPFTVAAASPYLPAATERSPLALLVGAAWSAQPPDWLRTAWSWQWHAITADQMLLAGIVLALLLHALALAVTGKALLNER